MKTKPYFHILIAVFLFIACEKKDGKLEALNQGSANNTRAQGKLASDSIRIVVLGASTAAGKGASVPDSAWVNRLRVEALKLNPRSVINNRAQGGYTTIEAMPTGYSAHNRTADPARNITYALSQKPDLVMITMPGNDVASGYPDAEILSNFAKIASMLDSAKVPYIMFGLQPRNSTDDVRLRLKNLNDKMAAIYTTRGNNYFNQLSTPELKLIPELSTGDGTGANGDGIHLNNKGHKLIMNIVLNHPIFQQVIKQAL